MRHATICSTECPPGAVTRFQAGTVLAALLMALACAFAGCSSDDDSDSDGDGAAGRAETEPDAGEEPGDEGITLSWAVRPLGETFSGWAGQPGLEGVEVCLIESVDIPCVTTDEEGMFVLEGAPRNRELLLTFSKEGYIPCLVSVRTMRDDVEVPWGTQPFMIDMESSEQDLEALEAAGIVVDESKGAIEFAAADTQLTTGIPGRLSVSIEPAAGDGPVFYNTNLQIDPDATGLSDEIIAADFFNLEDGEYLISWEAEGPEKIECEIVGVSGIATVWGLPAARPDAMRVKVRAGFISPTMITCIAAADPADAGA